MIMLLKYKQLNARNLCACLSYTVQLKSIKMISIYMMQDAHIKLLFINNFLFYLSIQVTTTESSFPAVTLTT